jgi:DNA-directed RNA polymerase specialized sigma24 family protein
MRRPAAKEVFGLDLDLIAGEGADPEAALEEKEGRERLMRLMREHLDRVEQEALSLRCFERMPVETITRVMDIREASGARGVLQRARRKLRSALEKNGNG